MEQSTSQEDLKRRIYSVHSISIGTFLGGPLVTSYLVAENFKTLGQKDKVAITWTIALVATGVIFGGLFLLPFADKIPNQLIPLVNAGIAYFIAEKAQGTQIKTYLSEAGKEFSKWRAFGISLVGAVITMLPILAYVLLMDTGLPSESKTYGALDHKIYFDDKAITEEEVDRIADVLRVATFFDETSRKEIIVNKEGNKYIIAIPFVKNAWNDPEVLDAYDRLRVDIQRAFTENRIVLHLCSEEDINQVMRVLE